MTFFESLLVLLLIAIALLQLARRLSLPYPTMLAAAGVVVAVIPGTPTISIDPVPAWLSSLHQPFWTRDMTFHQVPPGVLWSR